MIVDSLHWFILNFWSLWLLPLFWLLLFLLLLLLLWASHRLLTSILPILLWLHLYDYLLNLYLRVLHHRSSSSNSVARHDSLAPPLSSNTTTTTFNRCNSLSLVPRHQNTLVTNI